MALIDTIRLWVYTASVKGKYQKVHRVSGVLLQAFFVLTPWIMIGGHPAVQIDIPGRRLYALGETFTPTDSVLLALMGLAAAFGLFLFTALLGRLWCGYACPQTVYLEEWVRPIEHWFEGERGVRMARDKGPATFDKVWRKAGKWTAFLLLAFFVSMTFVSWFSGARELWSGQGTQLGYSMVGAFTVVMFLDFAWFREQFCNYLCPYARFQGVLCDDHSLVVAYDQKRGEPRGKPGSSAGACIDCNKCVVVCPTGIDIRNGFQLECISCGRCVDACQIVMDKRGQPNLIGYEALTGELKPVRARTVAYSSLLGIIAVAFVAILANRHDIDGNISRSPGSLYTTDRDGFVRNTYLLRLTSHESSPSQWHLSIEGLPEAAEVITAPINLTAAATTTVPVVVRVPPGHLSARSIPLNVVVRSHDDELSLSTTFVSEGS